MKKTRLTRGPERTVYGVIAYVAASRMREFAIRAALGTDRARVTRLVPGHGVRLATFGLARGLARGSLAWLGKKSLLS